MLPLTMPVLQLKRVNKVYGSGGWFGNRSETVALRDVSLDVLEEEHPVVAVVGESGSGKTTLTNMLLGSTKPTEGTALYRGTAIPQLSRAQRQTFIREVQAIFQDPFEVFNPFYKIDYVLNLPLRNLGIARDKAERLDRIEQALMMVGLRPEDTLGRYPSQLSGGQRQRVMVARAVLIGPKVLLADEPVSMVDASLRATILQSLLVLNRELGVALIYITHDLTTAFQIADRIIVLYRGSIVEAGDAADVIRDPRHPYTQLLVESIPRVERERSWAGAAHPAPVRDETTTTVGEASCPFVGRCPMVFDRCRSSFPPMFAVSDVHAAACFLERDQQVVPLEEVSRFMRLQTRKQASSDSGRMVS